MSRFHRLLLMLNHVCLSFSCGDLKCKTCDEAGACGIFECRYVVRTTRCIVCFERIVLRTTLCGEKALNGSALFGWYASSVTNIFCFLTSLSPHSAGATNQCIAGKCDPCPPARMPPDISKVSSFVTNRCLRCQPVVHHCRRIKR
jgi:hypothetical protein